MPSNGPGDGSGASISSNFEVDATGEECTPDTTTAECVEMDTANGTGAGHVCVLITIFSGFRPGRTRVEANLAKLGGVRCGCFSVLWANFANVFGLYFSGRLTLNEFERKYLCDGDPTGLIGADCGLVSRDP